MFKRFNNKPYHELTRWFCEVCVCVFNTNMRFSRKRCQCGRWMLHVTEEELERIRENLRLGD
jgi:hypothetical protein